MVLFVLALVMLVALVVMVLVLVTSEAPGSFVFPSCGCESRQYFFSVYGSPPQSFLSCLAGPVSC